MPRMSPPQKLATFKLPLAHYERLERLAELDHRTVSAVLRLAVLAYLAQHEDSEAAA